MAFKKWTKQEENYLAKLIQVKELHPRDCVEPLNKKFKRNRSFLGVKTRLEVLGISYSNTSRGLDNKGKIWSETKSRDTWVIDSKDSRIRNWEDAVKKANVDLDIWEVVEVKVGAWDVTMKIRNGNYDKPFRGQNQRISIKLKRKVPEILEDAVERVLERIKSKSPVVKFKSTKKLSSKKKVPKRAFEVCIMDPHYGMRSFPKISDNSVTPEKCAEIVLKSLDELIQLSKLYGPFEEAVLPIGNDFFHSDNGYGTTTGRTPMLESESYLPTFIGGEQLAIEMIKRMKAIAPKVHVYAIPGNHDRMTSFMLGRVLNAYYFNDETTIVHANPSPYKFYRYGCNLIGYEHGHNISTIRLATLMANECPQDWAETSHGYREWHLGDQHRKGSMKPTMFEEQGVSVEFLPGLTVPNEWHRAKSFNWQKRGSMGFIWDKEAGPISRLQVNIDRQLDKLMGS